LVTNTNAPANAGEIEYTVEVVYDGKIYGTEIVPSPARLIPEPILTTPVEVLVAVDTPTGFDCNAVISEAAVSRAILM
jgi:hypothetical protein